MNAPIAMLNEAQIRHLRIWLGSDQNETWVRTEDVTDVDIRQAYGETAVGGSIDLAQWAARLVTLLREKTPTTAVRLDSDWDDAISTLTGENQNAEVLVAKGTAMHELVADDQRIGTDLDTSVEVEIPTPLLAAWRSSREHVIEAMRAYLRFNDEVFALWSAAEQARDETTEREEREAEEDALREEDAKQGSREFYIDSPSPLMWQHPRAKAKDPVVHLLTCSQVPEHVATDFTHYSRYRAQDVDLLAVPCRDCSPVERLDALSDGTWSTRAADARRERTETARAAAEVKRNTRDTWTHRKLATAMRKMGYGYRDGYRYDSIGFGDVRFRQDRTEAVLWYKPENRGPSPETFAALAATAHCIGEREIGADEKPYYVLRRMTPAEKSAAKRADF